MVINTCGFIDSAKQEGINTILEMAEYKKRRCKYLIVIGCLVKRYKEELKKAIPEVDLFLSIEEYNHLWETISQTIENKVNLECKLDYLNRTITTGKTTAYLKIAEGCSNYCTYCSIPYIRGNFISRPIEEILKEANILAQNGVKEMIVIAQDTTKYGIDIYGKPKLAELLEELCKIKEFDWIRFLYAYPESITEELIQVVKKNDKICKYFDIPIQHISDKILKKMNRKTSSKNIKHMIEKLKQEIPECILRTSLIVGFPGETETDFEELCNFVKETKFDKLGVFPYSREEGTPAAKFENQIHPSTKVKRYNKIMKIQKAIAEEKLTQKIGQEHVALIEQIGENNQYYITRTDMDVPDMDGIAYIKNTKEQKVGDFIHIRITKVEEYDLYGEML